MRNWLWRACACAGGAFAGCTYTGWEALWTFIPASVDRSFTEALLPSPRSGASDEPVQRRSHRHRTCDQSQLVKECETFLAGRYHELPTGNGGEALPGWAWINPLAHADHSELKRLAHLSAGHGDPLAFLSYLAEEVLLRTSGDDVALRRIQHDSLVPLELDLIHHASSSDPAEIARIIRDRLDDRTSRSDSAFSRASPRDVEVRPRCGPEDAGPSAASR